MRTVEAQNPGGNVIKFHTPHPIMSWKVKFFYGEENVAARFVESECSCLEEIESGSESCNCWNVYSCSDSAKAIQLTELSPWAPLQNNSYKIYWGYAGGGNFWDRVEIKVCGTNKCCTAANHSIYMEYAFGAVNYKTIYDTIPVSPAYLVPLSFFFKTLLAPAGENWLAWQEQNYYTLAVDMVTALDKFDRTLNVKWFIAK